MVARLIADEYWICKRCGCNERNNSLRCKRCIAIRSAKWYAKNIEKVKVRNAKWRQNNPTNARWHAKNIEKSKTLSDKKCAKKRIKRDQALTNLIFLQLADELGKMINE